MLKVKDFLNKHKADVIVISIIVAISVAALAFLLLTKTPGAVVLIEIDGNAVAEYPLYANGTYQLNGGTNVLVIENGEAYLSYSECPDHTCELTGKIRYVGESIICLPNKLSVTVKGNTDNGVDLVS